MVSVRFAVVVRHGVSGDLETSCPRVQVLGGCYLGHRSNLHVYERTNGGDETGPREVGPVSRRTSSPFSVEDLRSSRKTFLRRDRDSKGHTSLEEVCPKLGDITP